MSTEKAGELDPRGGWEASSTAIGTAASGNNTDNRPPFHIVAFIQRVEPWTQATYWRFGVGAGGETPRRTPPAEPAGGYGTGDGSEGMTNRSLGPLAELRLMENWGLAATRRPLATDREHHNRLAFSDL